jgi:photosystem II stability/assembly factor-like uncharacterized protein
VSGRIDVAVANPTNPNIVYVGGAAGSSPNGGGGIWMTRDFLTHSDPQGPTWVPLIDNMPSLSIFAKSLTISPSNPNILYAAAQGPDGCILKTTNGGLTWTALAQSQFANAEFGAIVVNPTNPNIVYVAVRDNLPDTSVPGGQGVFESTDSGATWTNITAHSIGAGDATDLVIDPTGQVLYTGIISDRNPALNGVYQSLNGGSSWTLMTNGINNGGSSTTTGVAEYIRLTMAPGNNSNYVYAMMFLPTGTSAAPTTTVRFVTTEATGPNPTWTTLSALPENGPNHEPDGSDNRFWHMVLAVDPNDPNIVYTNGQEPILVGSKDGGTTWSDPITSGEDVVNIFYNNPPASSGPSPVMLVGDRGIQVSSNPFDSIGTSNFVGKRGNLGNFLVYNTAVNAQAPRQLFGVAQDQLADLERIPGSLTWNYLANLVNGQPRPVGNELGRILVDPTHGQIVYSFQQIREENPETAMMIIQVSTDGGLTWTPIVTGLDTSQFPASSNGSGVNESDYNAFILDPNNPNHLLVGAQGVWEATFQKNLGNITWTEINNQIVDPDGEGPNMPAQVTAVAVAPSDANILYAATSDSKIWRIDRSGTAGWQLASGGLPLPSDKANNLTLSINIDPKNPNHVFINTEGVFPGAGRVWMTTRGGTSWTPLDATLPATQVVHSLAVDWRFRTPVLYAGLDHGVYQSTSGGLLWSSFGTGLPHTSVNEIALLPQANLLTAATFGRGVWQTSATIPTVPVRLIYYGDQALNLGSGRVGYLLTFQNTSASALPGPITIVFPTLPASVPIVGVQVATAQGVMVLPSSSFTGSTITLRSGLAAGQRLTLLVVVHDPGNAFVIGQAQRGIPTFAFSNFDF